MNLSRLYIYIYILFCFVTFSSFTKFLHLFGTRWCGGGVDMAGRTAVCLWISFCGGRTAREPRYPILFSLTPALINPSITNTAIATNPSDSPSSTECCLMSQMTFCAPTFSCKLIGVHRWTAPSNASPRPCLRPHIRCAAQTPHRRSANYQPSSWSDEYIQSLRNDTEVGLHAICKLEFYL